MTTRTILLLICACFIISLSASEHDDASPKSEPNLSLDLLQVLQRAAATTAVTIAQLDRHIAEQEVLTQRHALRPRLHATGTFQRQDDVPRFKGDDDGALTTYEARVHLRQAILDLPAWHRSKAAKQQYAVQGANLNFVTDQSLLAVALSYLDALTLEARAVIRTEDLALAKDLYGQAKSRADAGASEPITATRAAAEVEVARSALLTSNGLRERALIELARLLDLPAGADITLLDKLHPELIPVSPLVEDPQAAETFALTHRSEMKLNKATLAALEANVAVANASKLPQLEAYAELGYGGVWDDTEDETWNIGLSLNIPLISDNRYRIEQTKLRRKQQAVRNEQVDLRIRAEVRRTIVAINNAQARLAADMTRKELSEAELSQAQARFDKGLDGNLAVVQAQRSHSSAKRAYTLALSELLRARIQFIAALGSIQALSTAGDSQPDQ